MRSIFFFLAASLYVLGVVAGNQNITLQSYIDHTLKTGEEVLSDSDMDNINTGSLGKEAGPTLKPFPALVTSSLPKPTATPPIDIETEIEGNIQVREVRK